MAHDELFWQSLALSEPRPEDRIAAIQEVRDQAFLAFLFQMEIDEGAREEIAERLVDPEEIIGLLRVTWYDRKFLFLFLGRLKSEQLETVTREAREYGIRKWAIHRLDMQRKAIRWSRRTNSSGRR